MDRVPGKCAREVRRVAVKAEDESTADHNDQVLLEGEASARFLVEISDKDYRSFFRPCYALEEIDDDKPQD